MANVLTAIDQLARNPVQDLLEAYNASNRANSMGQALETYVKDLFAGVSLSDSEKSKIIKYSRTFAFTGNKNNPPDFMLVGGDAVEIKKIESVKSGIALNSSYPKSKLAASDPMITIDCKNCENWHERDVIYSVGFTNKQAKKLDKLWLVYGDCLAADKNIYERIKSE